MLCHDTGSHDVIRVPGLKAKEAKDFGKAVSAIRMHDKGNGEVCVPVNNKKILKFRITLEQYPESA